MQDNTAVPFTGDETNRVLEYKMTRHGNQNVGKNVNIRFVNTS